APFFGFASFLRFRGEFHHFGKRLFRIFRAAKLRLCFAEPEVRFCPSGIPFRRFEKAAGSTLVLRFVHVEHANIQHLLGLQRIERILLWFLFLVLFRRVVLVGRLLLLHGGRRGAVVLCGGILMTLCKQGE